VIIIPVFALMIKMDLRAQHTLGGDSPLTGRPHRVRAFNALVEGVGAGAADPREPRVRWSLALGGVQPSSEAEFRPRRRPALERGGVSVVRRWAPRAKRSFTRGVPGPTA
jgi:hypothetical protein